METILQKRHDSREEASGKQEGTRVQAGTGQQQEVNMSEIHYVQVRIHYYA